MNKNFRIVDFFSRIVDLLILNLLFVITSLPIITLGASLCALFATSQKMVRNEESYIIRNYFHAFRLNFNRGTVSMILFIFSFIILFTNLYISILNTGLFFVIHRTLSLTFIFILSLYFLYYFPILARFQFNYRQILLHIPHMIISYPMYTFFLLALNIPLLFFFIYSHYTAVAFLFFMFLTGFSVITYIESFIFRKIFENYEI